MGAVGNSAHDAAVESFHGAFKRETLKGHKGWSSECEVRLDAFRRLTLGGNAPLRTNAGPRAVRQFRDSG